MQYKLVSGSITVQNQRMLKCLLLASDCENVCVGILDFSEALDTVANIFYCDHSLIRLDRPFFFLPDLDLV